MKIIWRDKSLPHQLDVRFVAGGANIQAYCNCGAIILQGRSIDAGEAIQIYNEHIEEVDGQKP